MEAQARHGFTLCVEDFDFRVGGRTSAGGERFDDELLTTLGLEGEDPKSVDVDGYRFKQKDGKWWWLTIRTNGKVLTTPHKFEFDFGPEKPGSVTLKPKGKDLGSAHGRTPGEMTFQVPNDYQIIVNDAKLGKLVYEAKIGTASE